MNEYTFSMVHSPKPSSARTVRRRTSDMPDSSVSVAAVYSATRMRISASYSSISSGSASSARSRVRVVRIDSISSWYSSTCGLTGGLAPPRSVQQVVNCDRRCGEDGDVFHPLNHGFEGGPRRVLVGIADCVAGHGRRVGVGALAAQMAV